MDPGRADGGSGAGVGLHSASRRSVYLSGQRDPFHTPGPVAPLLQQGLTGPPGPRSASALPRIDRESRRRLQAFGQALALYSRPHADLRQTTFRCRENGSAAAWPLTH